MATATLTRTDEEIQQAVLAELKWDARIQPNEIGVSVKDGVVTLTGWVDSFLKKWDAEEAAWGPIPLTRIAFGFSSEFDPASMSCGVGE